MMQEKINSLSLVKRYDSSYFYVKELCVFNGLYKYILVDWESNHLGKPIIVYSHTKRSSLNKLDREFFDNNLLNKNRIIRYIKKNLYIGGINRVNGQPVREVKDGVFIKPNYKVYLRSTNYIIIELEVEDELNLYNIYEFINKKDVVDFEMSSPIYSEKDFMNLGEEEAYVLNNLLDSDRVRNKIKNANGYVGTVEKVNGVYKKISNESYKSKFGKNS